MNDETREEEELVEKCIEVIRQEKKASTSLFQRRLRIGYIRANEIMEILEKRGIVGPAESATEPRTIHLPETMLTEMRKITVTEPPAICIGSRWRNKAHGFVMTYHQYFYGTFCLSENPGQLGFGWAGKKEQLLQQWEQIEP